VKYASLEPDKLTKLPTNNETLSCANLIK